MKVLAPTWQTGVDAAYRASRHPALVDVPELAYLTIDGHGDPAASTDYTDAVETLFSVAYAARFDLKRNAGIDVKVMPLEGKWWSDAAGDVGDPEMPGAGR